MLGWALHLPYVSEGGRIPETDVQLDLTMGPGVSITGDVVWDQSQGRAKDQKLRVKLTALLSTSETVSAENERARLEAALGDEALAGLRQSALGPLDERQQQHDQERGRVEAECDKLRQEVVDLKKAVAQPTEKAIKSSAGN